MDGYGQFCPLAKGAEVFAERWTPLVLRELLRGSRQFNDIHRGVPRMSRTLLSARLRKLSACGVVSMTGSGSSRRYQVTPAGEALAPVVRALGTWGHAWYRSRYSRSELDAGVLMWDMRNTVDVAAFGKERVIVQFDLRDAASGQRTWWFVNEPPDIDLCPVDPGEMPELIVTTTVATLGRVWMGDLELAAALRSRTIELAGEAKLHGRFLRWLTRSPYADVACTQRAPLAAPR